MLKNRKQPINEFLQTKRVTKDVWEKYFRKLYSNTEEAISIENYETNHQITLSEEEVMTKIKKLKNRKASGTYGTSLYSRKDRSCTQTTTGA